MVTWKCVEKSWVHKHKGEGVKMKMKNVLLLNRVRLNNNKEIRLNIPFLIGLVKQDVIMKNLFTLTGNPFTFSELFKIMTLHNLIFINAYSSYFDKAGRTRS